MVPSVNDVDCSVHVVVLPVGPRNRHSVVGPPCAEGSNNWKLATTPFDTDAGADCVTVNVCPAIVTVPARAAPAFAATVSVTVPLPVPLPPADTVMNGSLLTAVQLQVLAMVTPTACVPPPAATAALVGDKTAVHGATVRNVSTAE